MRYELQVGNVFELLNCDDHTAILRKHNRTPGSCRPDITHQTLLMLMDSPLNRAGLLQVFIRTHQNVLIEVNPVTRIPRTFKRFAGMMVQLLNKFCVRADTTTGEKLLKVIKNPITNHLPVGCKKLTMSFTGNLVGNCRELVPKDDKPIVVVIGAFAHGNVEVDYTEESISISKFPLSAALTCTKICNAFEEVWNVEWGVIYCSVFVNKLKMRKKTYLPPNCCLQNESLNWLETPLKYLLWILAHRCCNMQQRDLKAQK